MSWRLPYLQDEDPYVRKTAAVCVAKLFDINPELVEDRGFLDMLRVRSQLLRHTCSCSGADLTAEEPCVVRIGVGQWQLCGIEATYVCVSSAAAAMVVAVAQAPTSSQAGICTHYVSLCCGYLK